ncbi:flagellar protein FlgT [Vibrio ponticus]|nr:flagellar protein FlgT [Vibrio ponticus]
MKKSIFSLFSTILLSMIPWVSHAAWYEVTGMATIVASEDAARIHALEDAIYKAVSFSGADIGSIANLSHYWNRGVKNINLPTMKCATS